MTPDASDEKVKAFLRKSGADAAETAKIAAPVGKLLKNNLSYMVGVDVGSQAPGVIGSNHPVPSAAAPTPQTGGARDYMIPYNDSMIEFRMGTYLIRLPIADRKTAKNLIDTLLDTEPQVSQDTAGSGQ